MKVLIADDDDITRLLLGSALTKLGHKVHAVANGREAWDAWHGGEFSFIISDWMMPDLDGLEFCRRIRAEPRADYTYIVLLTSCSGKTNYLEAMNAGADDFITKPFEKDALTDAQAGSVQHILTSRQLLLQLIDRILAVSKSKPDDLGFLDASKNAENSCNRVGCTKRSRS